MMVDEVVYTPIIMIRSEQLFDEHLTEIIGS